MARRGASFSNDVVVEAVRLYVQGLPSYRTLAALLSRQLDRPVSAMTLNRWVHELGGVAKTPLEVSASLAPTGWGGILGVDGKAIFVAGEERTLLVGVDQGTQDIVNALVLRTETEDGFERLVRDAVTVAGYPLQGLVIDAAPSFMAAHLNYFPRLPLQLCRVHASRRLDFDIPKAKRSPDAPLRAELKDRIRKTLFAPDEATARHRFAALLSDRKQYPGPRSSRHHRGPRATFRSLPDPLPPAPDARRHQHHRKRHQAARQKAPADGGLRHHGIRRTFHPPPCRLLPIQTLHRLLPTDRQREITPRTLRCRTPPTRLTPLPPPTATTATLNVTPLKSVTVAASVTGAAVLRG